MRKFCVLLAMLTVPCFSQAVRWSANGHWYQVVASTTRISWQTAHDAATARGGYLATSTSAEENDFIFSMVDRPEFWWTDPFQNNIGPWLGAHFNGIAWQWMTGEPWNYTNWELYQPDGTGEDRLHYYAIGAVRKSTWNNLKADAYPLGYVIEWDSDPGAVTCTYTLSFGGEAFPASGGAGFIDVKAPDGCSWTASSALSWLTLTGGSSGTGNGKVTCQVTPNAGAARSGSLTVAGLPFTVEQAGGNVTGLVETGSMSQLASGGSWKTAFTLVNNGAAAAQARLGFFGENGQPLWLPLTFPQTATATSIMATTIDRTLQPGATLVIETTGPADQATSVGWAQLLSNGQIGGFAVFGWHVPAGTQEAVVPLETRKNGSFKLAFDNSNGYSLGVALANVAAASGDIGMVVRDEAGTLLSSTTLNLPARGHSSFMLTDRVAAAAQRRGTVELQPPAGGQISALGIRANPNGAITTVPAGPGVTAILTSGSMSQLASGGSWKTTFTLVNNGASPAQARLNFFAESGEPMVVPLSFPQTVPAAPLMATTIERTIQPGASLVIETAGATNESTSVGWAQLQSDGSIAGFAVFGWTVPAGVQEAVVPLETRANGSFVLSFDNTNGYSLGVALANVAAAAANIQVVARDDTGAVLSSETIPLPARGHSSFMLVDELAGTAQRRGTVEFLPPAGGQISALGIRANSDGAITTVPPFSR